MKSLSQSQSQLHAWETLRDMQPTEVLLTVQQICMQINMSIAAKPPVFAKREREDDGVRDEDIDYESLPSPAKKCAAR